MKKEKKPRKQVDCPFCEGACQLEAYEKDTSPEEIQGIRNNMKICKPHNSKLEDIQIKIEAGRAAA